MIAVFAIGVMVIMFVVSVVIALLLRSYVLEDGRTEARLRDPRTHTLAYAIPNGVDPVVFMVGLTHAGFTTIVDKVGNAECLVIECAPTERAAVRAVIESAQVNAYDGSALTLNDVVFEDER